MFVFQQHYWMVLTGPRSGWERGKEAVKIFPEERKVIAVPCTSQEFPLLVEKAWGARSPGPPGWEQDWVHLQLCGTNRLLQSPGAFPRD